MKKKINPKEMGIFQLSYNNLCDEFEIDGDALKESISDIHKNNPQEKRKSRKSLFKKLMDENDEVHEIAAGIHTKIISNVEFRRDTNKERGSGNSNSNYTNGMLSSQKYSFDYSSKSGSKEAGSLKDGIKEFNYKYNEKEEELSNFCKEYVEELFNECIEDIKRKRTIAI